MNSADIFFLNPQPKQNSIAVLVENFQGFSSLSRVFNRSDQSHSEEHPQVGSDNDSDSELVRAIWMSLENDGNNHNLQESSNESQVQLQLSISDEWLIIRFSSITGALHGSRAGFTVC